MELLKKLLESTFTKQLTRLETRADTQIKDLKFTKDFFKKQTALINKWNTTIDWKKLETKKPSIIPKQKEIQPKKRGISPINIIRNKTPDTPHKRVLTPDVNKSKRHPLKSRNQQINEISSGTTETNTVTKRSRILNKTPIKMYNTAKFTNNHMATTMQDKKKKNNNNNIKHEIVHQNNKRSSSIKKITPNAQLKIQTEM